MPTIFAIDGAEDFGGLGYLGELGAYSSAVATLQTALKALGQKLGDATLSALALDGLIGPKTTAATNRALTMYVQGMPAQYATGTLSQATVGSNAAVLAQYVTAEANRRGATVAPAAATPASVYVPSVPGVSDNTTAIVKWAAIGLGGVVVASVLYYIWRLQQGKGGGGRRYTRAPAFRGLGDFGGDRLNDREREMWVMNDEGLYRWWRSEQRLPGGIRGFIRRHRAEIDAVIQR